MKKKIYLHTRSFRASSNLNHDLRLLAERVNRHESDIIRQAVSAFVGFYLDHPDELKVV